MNDVESLVAEHRDRLLGLAYRMLGSYGDAEDVVQETFLRWSQADQDAIANPGGWLTTVCSRLCLDRLGSATRRREHYVGPWLPEPLLTDSSTPADAAELADTLSLAFLVVLERLSPAERAAFLLHDVFGYPHADVAAMLERSEAAARQLVSRARRRIDEARPRYDADAAQRNAVAEAFLAACSGGDVEEIMSLLAPEVTFTADGGGVVLAARHPVVGARKVAQQMRSLVRAAPAGTRVEPTQVNGQPGIVVRVGAEVDSVMTFDVADGRVTAVWAVRNPQKLRALGVYGS